MNDDRAPAPVLSGQQAGQLAGLLAGLAGTEAEVPANLLVTGLTLDSRAVQPGGAFLACQGRTQHGLAFAPQAVSRGARAIVYEPVPGVLPPVFPGVSAVAVPGLGRHLGEIAARFFGRPAERLRIAGVTGTNGKTTSAWLLAQALTRAGRPCTYLGTLGAGIPPDLTPGEHTTPDAIRLQAHLAQSLAAGAGWMAMEVSSHAIDQDRIAGTRFEVAAFTNLTRDHLDYHGTMEAYGGAKARLFSRPGLTAAVLNIDDPFGRTLAPSLAANNVPAVIATTRATGVPGDLPPGIRLLRAAHITPSPAGLALEIESSWGPAVLTSPLVGGFNAENLLTVLGMLLAWGLPLPEAVAALAGAHPASGRMERLGGEGNLPLAVVDYAHTPDALAKALRATREHCPGRLHVVFGCGGDRDGGKRPLMGALAADLADEVTLTDDNPRSEDPGRIVAEIFGGIAHPAHVHIEHDRELAIVTALTRARAGDAVLIAGKGHENYQIYGSTRRSFSDQAVVGAALEKIR